MPHKLLERQYQLQAQKRHADYLKHKYYLRTARYFEREAASAKQFNSWCNRGTDIYIDLQEKKHNAEKLQARRDKLRQLLTEENQLYGRELEKKKLAKTRTDDQITLEELRERLLQKKAEQSLYYPSVCRRLQSYAFSPNSYTPRNLELVDAATVSVNLRYANACSRENRRHSRSSSISKIIFQEPSINKNEDIRKPLSENFKLLRPSMDSINKRYSARSTSQSLQGTNIQLSSNTPEVDAGSPRHSEKDVLSYEFDKINFDYETHHNIELSQESNNVYLEEQKEIEALKKNERNDEETDEKINMVKDAPQHSSFENFSSQTDIQSEKEPPTEEDPDDYILDYGVTIEDPNRYRKGNMNQRESDCSGTADMSIQMYRYMKHNDFKHKISDLSKREQIFAVKHSWGEALRLREMRNDLILLKYKNIYQNHDLKIDDQTRQFGLKIIEARKALNDKRIRISDSSLYSDEAKDLYLQWLKEDDELDKTEHNTMKDILVKELEEDWKNLAHQDKNRMSQLYNRVMTKSDLQDEHTLATTIDMANNRQKQYMNYLAT